MNKEGGDAVQLIVQVLVLCVKCAFIIFLTHIERDIRVITCPYTYDGYKMFLRLWSVQMAQPVPPYLPEDLILRNDSWLLSVRRVKIGYDIFISIGDIKSL